MTKPANEVIEKEVEVITTEDIGPNKVDAILALAARVDALGPALDKIRTFVLKRALTGDWVKFGGKNSVGAKLALVGPGAERIAHDLGVSFTDWGEPKKEEGTDEYGRFYTYYYFCTVRLGGQVIERVEGRASSRDRFFGYESGKWKDLKDVKEPDIRTAARRCAMKEGVKLILGLRSIPEQDAQALGLDSSKVVSVEFGSGGSTTVNQPRTEKSVTKALQVKSLDLKKKSGKGDRAWELFTATMSDGTKADYFKSERDNKVPPVMEEALTAKSYVSLVIQDSQYGPNITDAIKAETPKAEAA